MELLGEISQGIGDPATATETVTRAWDHLHGASGAAVRGRCVENRRF